MHNKRTYAMLACAVMTWLAMPAFAADTENSPLGGGDADSNYITTKDVNVEANRAQEEAKYESQQTTIITADDIAKKQAKSVEDIIFNETGVTRSVDAMGRVGVSIRGAEPRHTLILVDGQPVMGDISKYSGQGDELQRLGTENVERIEIIKGAASAKYGADAIGGVINVITKKASKTPSLQLNLEGRRAKGNGDILPYDNFFLRADSGQMGKFKIAAYGSKRDIMPIYGSKGVWDNSLRNSLRYYGDIKNIGVIGTYEFDGKNKLDINIDRTTEDLQRNVNRVISENTESEAALRQRFKRNSTRDKQSFTYTGNNGGSTDWKISYDYSKLNEDDVTVSSWNKQSKYQGTNTLDYVDNLEHKQWDIKASANTQINDRHLLTYGFGYSKETGEGSRIKNAQQHYSKKINVFDYDKNIKYDPIYGTNDDGDTVISGWEPSSNVYNHQISFDSKGNPYYDQNYEWYGQSEAPAFTKEDYNRLQNNLWGLTGKDKEKLDAFADQLRKNNEAYKDYPFNVTLVTAYYNQDLYGEAFPLTLNGVKFQEIYKSLKNQVEVGKATINKHNFFIQDTWQINDNTILSPILRLDHSNLFGSHMTFNLGMTHNIKGKANQRFKANIGTGYTEPGMGELYYNWEMYSGSPVGNVDGIGSEIGRLGYYWIGNPDLKPEKSINFDMGIESENGKTSTRFNVFHNKIDNYLTTYFTGNLLDFHPGNSVFKFLQPPDMIYSFKNIGKAEITGIEAEINHKWDAHWSARLGYTYLQALNKSDPTMPDRLLDKPQHKVDIGVTYENKGWRASLWGNYYIHMLDSNSIAGNGNYMEGDNDHTHYFFEDLNDKKNMYQKKTFSIWNILVQKELSKDASMYVGIDNLFNHRDDDRALQERVYKMGVNLKFGPGSAAMEKQLDKTVGEAKVVGSDAQINTDWFIQKPFDTAKEKGAEIIGDYRARWNTFTGENRPEARVTSTASIGNAEKNMRNSAGHGFEQRLRLGVDARVGENTNVKILGSASGMSGVDTMHDVSDSKGMNHQRLDTVDVTQHADKWDFSIGRLNEPMGVTGYWFGKEYDGGRAVWTSGKNQVRVGYGDFSHSTGITDSAYTHATRDVILRVPTKMEWLGYGASNLVGKYTDKSYTVDGSTYEGLYQKLANTSNYDEQKTILNQYLNVIKDSDSSAYKNIMNTMRKSVSRFGQVNTYAWELVTVTDQQGNSKQYYNLISLTPNSSMDGNQIGKDVTGLTLNGLDNTQTITEKTKETIEKNQAEWKKSVADTKASMTDSYTTLLVPGQTYTISSQFIGYGEYTGSETLQNLGRVATRINGTGSPIRKYEHAIAVDDAQGKLTLWGTDDTAKQKAIDTASQSLWNTKYSMQQLTKDTGNEEGKATDYGYTTQAKLNQIMMQWMKTIDSYFEEENDNSKPLEDVLAGKLGGIIAVPGTILVRDQIPSIDRAFFMQAKHEITPNLGVQAWYFRSIGNANHSIQYANDNTSTKNEIASFDQLANIIGIGVKYRLGNDTFFSMDWGQNRTDFGRFMNGHTMYNEGAEIGSSQYFGGRANGGTPRFWVARLDVGHADTNRPGSWNAFADYKYFQHGSFFGGNGTEGLPDRYLDGIKSFTIGGGYVPAKDILLEAFYTFGAKGIGQRDTLYGPESFTLGDYTRIQATFKF